MWRFMIELYDSYGDGWNRFNRNNSEWKQPADNNLAGAGPEQFFISVDSSDVIDLMYTPWKLARRKQLCGLRSYKCGNSYSIRKWDEWPTKYNGSYSLSTLCQSCQFICIKYHTTDALIAWNSASGNVNRNWDIEWGLRVLQ